ncbi:MAG: hypothetical protein DRI56_06995 [Chloroflexota bacterium]|nr:MAG: hypothetical protein DRI56_06995 [Chloroflexota bacterium]
MILASRDHVFVIDDEEDTLNLVRLVLERKRFRVTTARTWNEIIDCARANYVADEPFNVIVLDLMMPERSGFDVLLALQTMIFPLPPVIVLSAITDFRKQIKAKELGATRYLTKPTTPEKLVQIIKEVLLEAEI